MKPTLLLLVLGVTLAAGCSQYSSLDVFGPVAPDFFRIVDYNGQIETVLLSPQDRGCLFRLLSDPARVWRPYIVDPPLQVVTILLERKGNATEYVWLGSNWLLAEVPVRKKSAIASSTYCSTSISAAEHEEILRLLRIKQVPNQLPDPTSPSVTPAAGAAGAPSVAADH